MKRNRRLDVFPSSSSPTSSLPTLLYTLDVLPRIITSKSELASHCTIIAVIITILILFLKPVDALDNVCEAPSDTGQMTYYVCMGDPLKVLSPNISTYTLKVEPETLTCGASTPQAYCTLTSPTQCFNCSNATPNLSHPKENMVDQTVEGRPVYNTTWQSMTWRAVGGRPQGNIVLTMGRRYILQDDIRFTFGGQRPKQAILEKSLDNGITWMVMQYYNYSCNNTLKKSVSNPDDVICTEKYSSEYPSTGGDMRFDLTTDRFKIYLGDNYDNFNSLYQAFQDTPLLGFLTFTDLRLRLIYPGTDGQEFGGRTTDLLKYYYSVSNIYLVAGCDCNRHAKFCSPQNGRMVCMCNHNTEGESCERCQPLYNNRPWQPGSFVPPPGGTANECQKCECYGRGTNCTYDSTLGRGRCLGCTNNTFGDKCDQCLPGFYKNQSVDINDPNICAACNCDPLGVQNGSVSCRDYSGQCDNCKPNVMGARCDTCFDQFWGLFTNDTTRGTCKLCNCNTRWTVGGGNTCDKTTGQCNCVQGVHLRDCSLCANGYFLNTNLNPQRCDPCLCDPGGSYNFSCGTQSSQCYCKPNLIGTTCHYPDNDFYVPYPDYLNFKPDYPSSSTTCQNKTAIITADAPYTGRLYFTCTSSQSATFTKLLTTLKHQGNIVQSYIPAIRYGLNSSSPLNSATLTISPDDSNPNLNASAYPNITVSTCDKSYLSVTFNLFNLAPGFGQAKINMSGRIDLDARCKYKADFKINDAGATFLLDSLVLVPDLKQSLAYTTAASDENRALYESCLHDFIYLNNSLLVRPAICNDFFFSLMAEQTGQALPCDCDQTGTDPNNPSCQSLGGQCSCLLNVGGRRCEYCLPGYYAFSSTGCISCSCNPSGSSSLVCDYDSGQCPCLPNVALSGENTTDPTQQGNGQCRWCRAEYYGIASGTGCQPCNCNRDGSISQQCNEDGSCQCKPTIGGMKCDACLLQYYGFSASGCQPCNCSSQGSVNGTCASDGQCVCKTNVKGSKCDQCKEGNFNLLATNPDGCQPCLCSGMSTGCLSATGFIRNDIIDLNSNNWSKASDLLSYVEAPSLFLGDKKSSYGQNLSFSITSVNDFLAGSPQIVILESSDGKRIYYSPPSLSFARMQPLFFPIALHEKYWLNSANPTQPLTATDMYRILSKLKRLMIQRTFFDLYQTSLMQVSLTSTINFPNASPSLVVSYVENCTSCQNNTDGLSCEKCRQGYRRATGDASSQCIPCVCNCLNSISQSICNEMTGDCLNCPNGSLGPQCQNYAQNVEKTADGCPKCMQGFWGLSSSGCQSCSCDPIGSKNTTYCDQLTGQCTCKENVTGLHCDRCQDGFVNMTVLGCSPCGNCYTLVVAETSKLADMLKNQSDVINLVNSSTPLNFADRLVQVETKSKFLNSFDVGFRLRQQSFNQSLDNISMIYEYLDSYHDTVLKPLQSAVNNLLGEVNTSIQLGQSHLTEASSVLILIYKNLPVLSNSSNRMASLTSSLEDIRSKMSSATFLLDNGFRALNGTVTMLENNALNLDTRVSNLTNYLMNQVLSTNQQLNSILAAIDLRVASLNSSALSLGSQTTDVKVRAVDLLNRATITYTSTLNVNNTAMPDIQGLSTNLSITLPNVAAQQIDNANNLLNGSTWLAAQVANIVVQNTTVLLAGISNFQKQVDLMASRISPANQMMSDAVNQSSSTVTSAINMLDVMMHFSDKSTALMNQATETIQSAGTFASASGIAINISTSITTSLQPVLSVADQVFNLNNNTLSLCLNYNQSLSPVSDKSKQLKIQTDPLLMNAYTKQQTAINTVQRINFGLELVDQTSKALVLTNRALAVRDDADQLARSISDSSQTIAGLSSKLNSLNPLTTSDLNSLYAQCQETKNNFNSLNLSLVVQNLQITSAANQLWIGSLMAKKLELYAQLARMRTIISKFS